MELRTNLQKKVLDLEKTKTTQANEIAIRVESSKDEEDLGKDASKQGRRINDIDEDEDITLINIQNVDEEMFDVDALDGEEVFVVGQKENVDEEVVDDAQVSTATTTVTITTDEVTLAQALANLKSTKPKAKGIPFKEPAEIDEEERIAISKEEKIDEANIAWDEIQAKVDADYQLAGRLQAEEQKQFTIEEKATLLKRAEEKRNKPPTKTQQKKIVITYLKNMEGWKHKDLKSKDFDSIKELFDKSFTRVNMFVDFGIELVEGRSKRAGEELEQENTKKQKVDEDKDTSELQSLMEAIPDKEEVAIDVVPLATKVFSQMLKSFTREDLEDLYKLVKAKYGPTRPVEDLDLVLWNNLKTIVHCLSLQSGMIYMLVEKRYPLTPHTITDMLNKKLQGRIVGIKSLLNAVSITAALIDVNAA
ncbi:hypothetical protein Tco_0984215 [Tanacetum coccineum]